MPSAIVSLSSIFIEGGSGTYVIATTSLPSPCPALSATPICILCSEVVWACSILGM